MENFEYELLRGGQAALLHAFVSEGLPTQSAPLPNLEGLVQVLVLLWLPPPQVLVQVDQALKTAQLPSAGRERLD